MVTLSCLIEARNFRLYAEAKLNGILKKMLGLARSFLVPLIVSKFMLAAELTTSSVPV